LLLLLLLLTSADSPGQLLQRGLVALQQGDLARARSAFEAVAKENPHNAYAWASLAETYARLKEPAAAEGAADKAEKFGSDNPAISHALSIYFAKAGQFGHAAALEQKFADSEQADAEAQQRAANLFLNAGKVSEALSAAERAVNQHPSPLAENVLGRALIAAGRPGEGEQHLGAACKGLPADAGFAFDYSQALLRKQEFGEAAEVLSTALQTHPDDAQLVLALGVARYGQRRFEDAITTFLKVIRINPQVEQPYVFLGKMLDQAGEHLPEITVAYEKWSKSNQHNAVGLLLLAKARLAADPKDATAEGLLRRSISLDARNWEAHYELGVLLEGKREWPAAAAELKRSAELDGKQAMPHYHLARVYDRLGDEEKAKAERALHGRLTGGER
jgi:tetratricopeptide (TPR) repeat protein